MNARTALRLSEADYLAWEATQEAKHELVDGVVCLMAGGTFAHFRLVGNLVTALNRRLRGGPCTAYPEGVKVKIPAGNVRYADVLVQCGPHNLRDPITETPTVLVEITSPSTEWFDETDKLEEYKTVPSARHVLLLSQRRAFGRLWSRAGPDEAWTAADLDGPEALLALDALAVALPLAEVYDGVVFEDPGAER